MFPCANQLISDCENSTFRYVTLGIFILAIIHTLSANVFHRWAIRLEREHGEGDHFSPKKFWSQILYFLGEIEVVFGFWAIPLFLCLSAWFGWKNATEYFDSRNYIEPIFVVVIMTLTATRPIVQLAESIIAWVAKKLGGGVSHWWLSLLFVGPILGSFLTEAGAMTLTAILLGKHFYKANPSKKLAYATLGLLFVNISVGGVLTNFAAPPVLIISHPWKWSTLFMLVHFGWKALIGTALTCFLYYSIFRKELHSLSFESPVPMRKKVPWWISLIHLLIIVILIIHEHDPPIFIGGFLLFLGFYQATHVYQDPLHLRRPLMVGLFLAGLVIHGGLQGWWIIDLMSRFHDGQLMLVGTVLTAFNDNAAITYLTSLVPNLAETTKMAIVSGVIVGGGLTVIANAPNPAGLTLLRRYFHEGVAPLLLLLAALPPTIIMFLVFFFSLKI